MIHQERAPHPFRQDRRGHFFVGDDSAAGAPALQPPSDQRRFGQCRRHDQNVAAAEIGRRKRRRAGLVGARQRNGDPEGGALSGRAFDRDRAAHAFNDAVRDRQAKAGAAEPAAGAAVGLLEFMKDAGLVAQRDADTGIAHRDRRPVRLRGRFDHDRYAAGFGEFDGVAGEIEQHLAQARGVAGDARGQALIHIAADFEALFLRPRPEQLDHFLDEGGERKRLRGKLEPAGLDFGKIHHFLDQRKQGLAGSLHRPSDRSSAPRSAACRPAARPCRECR